MEMSLNKEKNKTILIVDDEALVRTYLRDLLEEHGYRVCLAPDCKDVMRIFDIVKIDLVLTDIVMPDCDGFELIKALKGKVPIIAMTGRSHGDVYLKTARLMGVTTLAKPFQSSTVLETIAKIFANECD